MDMIISIVFALGLLMICFFWGKYIERRNYQEVVRLEKALSHILLFNERFPPQGLEHSFSLVSGSVVMSSDYFKVTLAMLKSFFGGRLNSYEKMMDLGRRISIIRMKQQAARMGATYIFNVRMETAMLNQSSGREGITSAEFFAYGTALFTKENHN